MTNEILTALLALIGTIVGSGSGILISNKLVNYRIEQLEKKLDKYASNVDEIRERLAVVERDISTAYERIDELREDVRVITKK